MSLLNTLIEVAERRAAVVASVDEWTTRTYAEVAAGGRRFARLYAQSRVPHVGAMLPTSGLPGMAMLGAWMAGKTFVSINYLLGREELRYCLTHSDIDLLVTTRAMLDQVGGASLIPDGIRVELVEETFAGQPGDDQPTPLHPWRDDEVGLILYTSGTSGLPKGVPLTFGNLGSNTAVTIKEAGFVEGDVFVSVMPQFHSFGLCALTIFPLAAGARVVYTPRFIPGRVLELFRRHRPSVFMAVPTMWAALLGMKDARREDFAPMRMCFSGGEPLPEAVRVGVRDRFGQVLCEGYGMTETSPVAAWTMPWYARDGYVGKPVFEMDIRIVDTDDRVVPDGEEGEVLMAGPNVFPGYYKDRASDVTTFAHLTIDGVTRRYIRSGDIGRLDGGYLAITGRRKELIIVGGFNVAPRTIEEVLNFHPAVRDSGVVGKRDGLRGEVPIAFVELKEGARFDESSIRAHCREHLANFKVPKEIVLLAALPRTPTGKVLRRKLKELV